VFLVASGGTPDRLKSARPNGVFIPKILPIAKPASLSVNRYREWNIAVFAAKKFTCYGSELMERLNLPDRNLYF